MISICFILLLLISILTPSYGQVTCASGWVQYGGSCYLIKPVFNSGSRTGSWLQCNTFSSASYAVATMLCVNNATEQSWMNSQYGGTSFWIGYTDMLPYGGGKGTKQYGWVTGCSFTYTNWDAGQPNNAFNNEDYVLVDGPSGHRWYDRSPQEQSYCGCQYNPAITTDPSSRPSTVPSSSPSTVHSSRPTIAPSSSPTVSPSSSPSADSSSSPSADSSSIPSTAPSSRPSTAPSSGPTAAKSSDPSAVPTDDPSADPSNMPTNLPSVTTTYFPSLSPTRRPTNSPSSRPTRLPSVRQTAKPAAYPTIKPTFVPTVLPTLSFKQLTTIYLFTLTLMGRIKISFTRETSPRVKIFYPRVTESLPAVVSKLNDSCTIR